MDYIACQAPLSMGFPWTRIPTQQYWSRLPFPPPGDLLNPGIELRFLALQVDSILVEPPGKPIALTIQTFVGKVMSLFFIHCLGLS